MSETSWIDADTIEPEREFATFDEGSTDEPFGNPALVEELNGMLSALEGSDLAIEPKLEALRRTYSDVTYSELIYLLSHLRFLPAEAREHWTRILAHRVDMQARLGSPVDLRVALASYFLEVNRKLHNPKIIEMQLFERTRDSAYRDGLTGLYNYRALREQLSREMFLSERSDLPLSLLMIDVDDFKAFNDANGHDAGNQALTRIAALLTGALRKGDLAARFGGEEFALILTATPKSGAALVAERILEAVGKEPFFGSRLTVSLGLATFPADATSSGELIRRADRALYVAKAGGKNQVTLYGGSRRSHGRVDAALDGECRTLSGDREPVTTVNLSEAGVLFETRRRIDPESLIELRLNLPGRPPVILAARVVHAADGNGRFLLAARFLEPSRADRLALRRFLEERRG
jgi:diguanylate cyclase (GGDEF)-like protein